MAFVTRKWYQLAVTTQGPTYPPSEVMDANGNFIVVGRLNRPGQDGEGVVPEWGAALVSARSPLPPFGQQYPYTILHELSPETVQEDRNLMLCTLPLPLPCNNYPMTFAPEQRPDAYLEKRPSYPFHKVPIPDVRRQDGVRLQHPVTLGEWMRASGVLEVTVPPDGLSATFSFTFKNMIPDTLYTVMSLREHDLDPAGPSRPGPLGIPNVFITDKEGTAMYHATLPNPFPAVDAPNRNRIVNVVVLWMSYQRNYGGAIGLFGLGGDVHAHLKLKGPSFSEFTTYDSTEHHTF
jgi:hypothetical protein